MIKFSFIRTLIAISLFFMTSCSNSDSIGSAEKHDTTAMETADSTEPVDSLAKHTAPSEKLKGVTVEQRDLNEIFKSISSKELTEEEQQIIIKQYQDSIQLHTPSAE